MRGLPFFKAKNKPQFAGLNFSDGGGGGGSSSLPIASADTLGGVKIGEGIDVSSDGTISASGGLTLSNTETVIGSLFGKPLYAKVFHFDTQSSSFSFDVGMNCIVKFVYGSGIYDNSYGCLSTPKASSGAYDIQATPSYGSSGTSVYISTGNSLITNYDILVVYTKTTD